VDGKLSTAFKIKRDLEPLYKVYVKKVLHSRRNTTVKEIKKLLDMKSWYHIDNYLECTLLELTYTELQIVLEKIMKIGYDWDLNFQASVVIFQNDDDLYIQFFSLV
jgi:hypothetical protein